MTKLIAMLLALVVGSVSYVPAGVDTDTSRGNSLSGMSAAFVGDSISYGTNYAGGYGKLIGEKENIIVTNPSRGGATVTRNIKWSADSDGIRPCILDMLDILDGEYDFIIAEGGINDFWNHAPLGELTAGFENKYNEETFAGAMESLLNRISNEHPESYAGFVIIHDPFTYDAEEDFKPYYEMIKSVCEKWSAPCLDLYEANNKANGVNVRDAWDKEVYFSSNDKPQGDGTHPNEKGYMTIYVEPMTEWMKAMLK